MIKTEGLTFSYEAEGKNGLALENINIEIAAGEFVAVLGHNGSGKSTLAKHFNAILLPSGGKAYVDGIDTCEDSRIFDIRKKVGMVFQNPDNQIVAAVVEEDVAFGPENIGVPSEEIRQRVDDALAVVGMSDHKLSAPHNLSGGQKQRIAIAGIIAMRPSCIVLDEPTAMLDPVGRREVMDTIKKLNTDLGITIILITHYMDEAAKADRVLVMSGGKIFLDDTPREVFVKRDLLKSLGLDVPQATELMHRLKENGFTVNENVISSEDCANELIRLLKEAEGMK